MYRAQLGEAPQLEKVNENGEFKHGTMGEGSENYRIHTYGKIIGITRQAIINDDLSAFTRVPFMFGVQAANLESDLFWAIMTNNAAMGDGDALFHTNHSNLAGSGAVISTTTLSAARVAMMTQKGLDGSTTISVTPTHLVVPAAIMTTAQQNVTAIVGKNATKISDVNPFAGALEVVAEPRLDLDSAISWYVFSNANLIDMVEIATLDGTRGPELTTEEGFDIDGMRVRAYYDIGGAPIDYRGFYKNPGA
jgi:phage major head subunit gpT-like protein